MTSPYAGKPESSWLEVTRKLVDDHPLKRDLLLEAAVSTWQTLWQTTVGEGATSVRLNELTVPSTVVGYFFEVLLARELHRREPSLWRGCRSKDEKDLVYVPDVTKSIEVKTSGQCGYKIFGNRSYGQKAADDVLRKEKSGYYVTVNFYQQTLTLVRFGWIDAEDWDPQEAPTGQMAGLRKAVYDGKLIAVDGDYRQLTPVLMLHGVGGPTASQFAALGIHTIRDLMNYANPLPKRLRSIRERNAAFLRKCIDAPEGGSASSEES